MITPKQDVTLPDIDRFSGGIFPQRDLESVRSYWGGFPRQEIVALTDLPEGRVSEHSDKWKQEFSRDSVYPLIVVEICSDNTYHILQGNHRVIMWREWGFTHAKAWIIDYGKD